MFSPRPGQEFAYRYDSGKLGVTAVPGSGKTQTLSYLAARLIAEGKLDQDQEILVVTLVNSAVNNFASRIASFIKAHKLLPGTQYRIRTLHGLAHDIVRERPDLAGLSNNFQIVDEREASGILRDCVDSWLKEHPDFIQQLTNPEINLTQDRWVLKQWSELAVKIAGNFIRQAKDEEKIPNALHELWIESKSVSILLQMGIEIYNEYQRALNYRSAVDFDDLIRLALRAMRSDPTYLEYLQYRWPYVLEDEAQDSSKLQEKMLRLLTEKNGNWVRVGDPNQAIFETFTTANPKFLLNYLNEADVKREILSISGRSSKSIIHLANCLVRWVVGNSELPDGLRGALYEAHIDLTPEGDPQPNPKDNPDGIFLSRQKMTPDEEIRKVVLSISRWLPDNLEKTIAVLVPRNERGAEVVQALNQSNIETVELLQSSSSTREVAKVLTTILGALSDPGNPSKLSAVYTSINSINKSIFDKDQHTKKIAELLRKIKKVEEFLYPLPGQDVLNRLTDLGQDYLDELEKFRGIIRRWQVATQLPVEQLLLTISQDIFTQPAELALIHKIALLMDRFSRTHPEANLGLYASEIGVIAKNERKFLGFSQEDTGFDPDNYKGKVVVATIHKAKGLEWDKVYLLSVNNYDFPSGDAYENYIGEPKFIINKLNLQAELLDQLDHLVNNDITGIFLEPGLATIRSRYAYASERLRLLYVGITRARKELVITWNTGRHGICQPAQALIALQESWENHHEIAA